MKRLMVAGTVLALATGCVAGAGAAVGVGLIGVGIVTYECYQYAQITVIDGATGKQTCDAEVKAIQDGDEEVLTSCYHAPLTAGKWTLRAELPGRKAATTSFEVPDGCDHTVSTFVLTIPAPGAAPGPQPLLPAPPPAPTPAPAPTLAPAPTVAPPAETSPPAAPAPAPEAPAPSAPSSAAPPAPQAPPTQSFPD